MKDEAIVVGAGPNGLSAAILLAQAGVPVRVLEGSSSLGGGCRTSERTRPGFLHDDCSAIHPLGIASPFFRSLPLAAHGLHWVEPAVPLAHPLDGGRAAIQRHSLEATAEGLADDAAAYRDLFEPFVKGFDDITDQVLGPFRAPAPRHMLLLARFGLVALRSCLALTAERFRTPFAKAIFAGTAAHAMLPLEAPGTAAFGLVLGSAAHKRGWPLARGGSRTITDALAAHARSLGVTFELERPLVRWSDLPPASTYLLDLTPRQLLRIEGMPLAGLYRRRLGHYRYGPGVFKMDWALDGPIPWLHPDVGRAGTVHVVGSEEELAIAERAVARDEMPARPFVLLAQPSLFDDTRAPAGRHTAWGYCRVPRGSSLDATEAIEAQVERFAPGFRKLIVARATRNAVQMEAYNPNYVGGDIGAGAADLGQLFTRPVAALDPYRVGTTQGPGVFLCSASTPPGGGVHGMCGVWAARSALDYLGVRPDQVPDRTPDQA